MKYEDKILRHELKYYINYASYHSLRSKLKTMVDSDKNMTCSHGYDISSLYFDDVRNNAFHEKEDGAYIRKKYRIRIYNKSDTLIKLECKSKFDSFTSKLSSKLCREQYEKLLCGDYSFLPSMDSLVCTKLFCDNKLKLLKPKIIVDYKREAYVVKEGNVRITFDKNLQAGIHKVDLFDENLILTPILPEDIMILEIKYDDYFPAYLKRIVGQEKMDRCTISKFLLCANKLRKVKFYV